MTIAVDLGHKARKQTNKIISPKTHKRYVTSMCSNTCTASVGHIRHDMAYWCFRNLLPFLLKCNAKFLEKYKGSLIFGSANISYCCTCFLLSLLYHIISYIFYVAILAEVKIVMKIGFKFHMILYPTYCSEVSL